MKTRRYIGVAGSVLLILVILFIFTDPWSTIRNDGKSLVLPHPGSIDRIEVSDSYDSTSLVRQEGRWWLFGEEEANQVAVENLLFAAERLQVNSIQAETSFPEGTGRSIRYYSGNRLVLAYDLYIIDGSCMLQPERSSRSYFVSVSGFKELDLGSVFSASSNHYRQHLLIDLLPSDISMIGIELASGEGFRFIQDPQGEITCTASNPQTKIPDQAPDELAVRLLFSYFTAIRYEEKSGITAGELMEQEKQGAMTARLHVESFRGEKHTLIVFPYRAPGESEPDMFLALVLYNEAPEALVVKYIYLDVLMRDLDHYF